MTKILTPFLPWDTPDEDTILAQGLRADDTSAAGIGSPSKQSSSPALGISSEGVLGTAGAKALLYPSSSTYDSPTAMAGGCLSFEISRDYLASSLTVAADEYPISWQAGYFRKKTSGYVSAMLHSSDTVPIHYITSVLKDEWVRVDISWCGGIYDFYVDQLHVMRKARAYTAAGPTTRLYVGGLTTSAGYFANAKGKIRNVRLTKRPMVLPVNPVWHQCAHLGDSFTQQGSMYNTWDDPGLPPYWHENYGYTSGDVAGAGGSHNSDGAFIPEFYRVLAKSGYFPRRNWNGGRSGGTVATAASNIVPATSYAGYVELMRGLGYRPALVTCILGTNDVAVLRAPATFASTYQTLLTKLKNYAVRRVVLGTIPSFRADTSYTEEYHTNTVALNEQIKALPAWATAQGYGANWCSVVDLWSNFGGNSIDLADFQTANIHPSSQGSAKIGRWMGSGAVQAMKLP